MLDIVIDADLLGIHKSVPGVLSLDLSFAPLLLVDARKALLVGVGDFVDGRLLYLSDLSQIDICAWCLHGELLEDVAGAIDVWLALLIVAEELGLRLLVVLSAIALLVQMLQIAMHGVYHLEARGEEGITLIRQMH